MKYSKIERLIMAANNGRPIELDDLIPTSEARASYRSARRTVGLTDAVGTWATTDAENVKLAKSGTATVGTTFSPGDEPARMIGELIAGWRPVATGRTVTPDVGLLTDLLPMARRLTVCPMSTPGCRRGCVITTAGKGPTSGATLGRLARWVTLVTDPLAAVTLMRHSIECTVREAGTRHTVRFGVADDVRWELVAPALFAPVRVGRRNVNVNVNAYAYTKWSPTDRPATDALHLTYSATGEAGRWSVASIVDAVNAGYNVAAALDYPRGAELPTTWNGAPVVDGDESDDRLSDPRGVLVALRAKGAARQDTSGFVFARA